MNLSTIKEQLLKMGQKIGLQIHEETKDSLSLHSELSAKDYFTNSIYFRIVTFTSGTLHVFFTFDEIEKTYDNLFLINAFNAENAWFKAYITNINDKEYLELHYSGVALKEEQEVVDTVGFLLNELLNDNTLRYLNPILNSEK